MALGASHLAQEGEQCLIIIIRSSSSNIYVKWNIDHEKNKAS